MGNLSFTVGNEVEEGKGVLHGVNLSVTVWVLGVSALTLKG